MKKHSKSRKNGRSLRSLREMFFATRAAAGDTRRRSAIHLESLEGRLMLSSDFGADLTLPWDGNGASTEAVVSNQTAGNTAGQSIDSMAEGEDTTAPDLVAFAKALAATDGVKLFGAAWCPACTAQKHLFEDGADFLPFIEVTNPDRSPNDTAITENITQFPTWEFPDGTRAVGTLDLQTISQRAGVAIPNSNSPFVAPISDQVVLDGSPLHVGLDGYDPNGGPLTYTVVSSNPSVVQPTVLTGDRSATISVSGWGDMTFYLFEQQVPNATGRFITLAESGFYDAANNDPDITVHRVIDNFMMQFGDPTGTGAGGSSLGSFDDDFDPDLQHNTKGALSWAKSNDDTNDSQVFITDVPTRYLDFNHSYFGQLTEGDKVRDAITMTATDSSTDKPLVDVNISSVSIFDDTENGMLMLKAAPGATGTSDITVTVTDQDGHQYSETFQVTVQADTYNGGPYLEDIPAVQTTMDSAVTFQLSAIDVEGDAVTYGAVKTGSVDYTVSANSQTGEVTVTPPTGFAGTMDVLVYVRPATTSDTSDVYDTQLVSIPVTPDSPLAIDLADADDTGTSSTDNLTNATDLQFTVSGVADGALVRLHNGETVIGQATASGTTVMISTSSLASLGSGTYGLFATQIVDSVESPASPALNVTLDITAPPEFTSTPPTAATAGALLAYDVENPEEGTAGTTYSLVGAPDGVAINPATGEMTWTPTIDDIGVQSFAVAITDAAGNSRSQAISLDVASNALVAFHIDTTDLDGTPITSVDVGGSFELQVYVSDVSADPHGVFAAFLDLLYDQTMVAVDGDLTFGSEYPNNRVGDLTSPGLIDEAGAIASFNELGGGEYLLFKVPMKAVYAGDALFQSDAADNLPDHELLRFGGDFEVLADEVVYGSKTLTVNPGFSAGDDVFNVDEDSTSTMLDVLANDEMNAGTTGELTISQVGTADQGGTVEIASDGKSLIYTPAADFFGEETFTYTVGTSTGALAATVTVQVMPVNDDPTAVDDTFVVTEDASEVSIDVLANDLIAPDEGETLSILSRSTPSAGGTVTISPEKDRLLYTPATNFFGTETFTYMISDGNGGTSQASVTVTVTEANDPPEATNDLFTVSEDSSDNSLDVLGNDTTAGDANETLSIVEVSDTEHGGTVTIASDDLSLIYSPAADFYGTERFTYKITDGNGNYAEATVMVTVEGTNDPPTATDDTFTVAKDSTDNELDVLVNDSSAPDPAEALEVSAVGAPTAGGTVTINSDGTAVLYTPPAAFDGTDTFTYTIEDPSGATSQATVSVDVQQYIPSKLSGYVFLDVDNDGVKDPTETALGGVVVTLTGTDLHDNAVELQQTTDVLGFYQFADLAPGSYHVVESQPRFLSDGIDRANDQAYPAGTDDLPIELAQDSNVTGFNFGERGREAVNITVFDFFASTPRDSVLMSANGSGSGQWYAIEGGWQHAQLLDLALQQDMSSAQLNVTTIDAQHYSATLNLALAQHVKRLADAGADHLLRVVGSPSLLFPDADCACATNIGEGESAPVLVAAMGGEGEATGTVAGNSSELLQYAAPLLVSSTLDATPWNLVSPIYQPLTLRQVTEPNVLMAPTPADGYLATDLLMAQMSPGSTASEVADQISLDVSTDSDQFHLGVDEIMGQLLSDAFLGN